MKRRILPFLILSLAVAPAYAKRFASGPVELHVDPAKAPEPAEKYSLMAKAIENESGAGGVRNLLLRRQAKKALDPAYARIMQMEERFGNNLNVLQSVEAIRHYAATHDGRLPEKPADITDLEVPNDVTTGKPLAYRRTARGAVVESKIPEGGDAADTTRHEIILRK